MSQAFKTLKVMAITGTTANKNLVFVPYNNPIRSSEFQIFGRFIGVDWSLIYEDSFQH